MDCNRDEAVRAKDIAQRKMQSDDFETAKKFALKAQSLYSELDNIAQMLTTCNVHCSAKNKISGSEMDWYGILQVERFSDESTVKKQYRKLALVLHPDKNRFPGADGAFKLICEANALLLDAKKKYDYDSKIRVMLQTTRFAAQTQKVNRQTSAQARGSSNSNNKNQRNAAYSSTAVNLETFWTSCPSCRTRYRYLRQYLNLPLRCQSCKITFVGREIGPHVNMGQASEQNVQPKPKVNQTSVDENLGVGKKSDREAVNSDQNVKKTNSDRKAVDSDQNVEKAGAGAGAKAVKSDQNVEKASGNEGRGVTNATKAPHEDSSEAKEDKDAKRNVDSKSKTKSKKFVVESDTESGEETLDNQTAEASHGHAHYARRSSRKRGHVSYNENENDDFASPLKRPRHTESGNGDSHDEKAKPKNVEADTVEKKGPISKNEDLGAEKTDADGPVNVSIDFSFNSDEDTADEVSQCPDPEFSDFDQEREQSRFKVGQFWACYDTFDAMPRFYARVKNVRSSPFELTFTWLEADPIHESLKKWAEELPVGCGRFQLGETEKTSSLPTFSHQMHCEKENKRRNIFVIYPREGEVWAIFKDWDISWGMEAENPRKFKYEVVEVLTNFDEQSGVEAIHMDKIDGFVSLYQRAARACSFKVKPGELYRFSHRVLCKKMTGQEREGVPLGSYELDPASLPSNTEDLHFPYKTVVVENLESHSEVHCTPKRSRKEGISGKSTPSNETPKKTEEIHAETLKLRRSPRGLNGVREKVR